jgi:sugar lactone lactonase YvrE
MDGDANTSRFYYPYGFALSADVATLYVCDEGTRRIRVIDVASATTRTLAGSGEDMHEDGIGTAASIKWPLLCDWDRASDVEPFTSLYITAPTAVRRLNVKTGEMTTVKYNANLDPVGIVCLSGSGILILTCMMTHCMWTVDPRTQKVEHLAGVNTSVPSTSKVGQTEKGDPFSIRFFTPYGIALQECDQSILVPDSIAHTVTRVPLPDRVFVPPRCIQMAD